MSQRAQFTLVSILSAAVILSSERAALAQDALGGGNALDRNTQVGSGGRNSGAPTNPFAGRNSIITGEVIGGREFRGRVGYTAPGDFRGSLGSNDLFRFRADSAWSGAAGYRLSNSTFDQLRFGQGLGEIELARSGTGATPKLVMQSSSPNSLSEVAQSRLRYDNELLTATSASRITSAVQPLTLGTGMTADGREVAITASSVRGLTLDQFNSNWDKLGLSAYDQARMREENRATPGGPRPPRAPGDPPTPAASAASSAGVQGDRVGQRFETRFDDVRTDASATADARVDATASADYARLIQNIADRFAQSGDRSVAVDPAILKRLNDQYAQLRGQLQGQPTGEGAPRQTTDPTTGRPLPAETPSGQAPTSSDAPGQPDLNDTTKSRNQPENPDAAGGDANPDGEAKPVDLQQMGPVLRHGEKIERLSSEQQGRFNELMVAGEDQLKKGDYLLAEQRFQRALRFSPGNPLAMAGAANAQVGAGLYLPAGYTLRSLFTQHPEMIDATYAPGLLPAAERLTAAVEALKTRLETGNDRALLALVLAYLGRQNDDKALMEQGIKVMSDESADDPLAKLLRAVWLEGGEVPKAAAPDPEK